MNTNTSQPPIFTRNFIMVTVINMFIFFSFQMIFPTLPLYIKKLGGDDTVIGLVMGVFVVSSIITRPFAGLALDKIGRRPVFIAGLIILAFSAYFYGAFPIISSIVLIRLLHGLGWGIAGTSAATIAAEIIPKERFGEGMGYFSLANSLSMAIAPAAGIYISIHYGFKNLFTLSSVLVVASVAMAFYLGYRPFQPDKRSFRQIRLYDKSAWGPAFMFFFVSLTWGGVTSFLPLYAYSKGISDIGSFFSIYALAIIFSRVFSGKIIDRYGYDIAIIPGLILLIAALLLLTIAETRTNFLVVGFIYGLGFGAVQMSLQTMVVKNVPRQRLGAANATFYTGLDAGIGLGATILGSIAGLLGYADMYIFAAVSIFFSLLFYLFHIRPGLKKAVGN